MQLGGFYLLLGCFLFCCHATGWVFNVYASFRLVGFMPAMQLGVGGFHLSSRNIYLACCHLIGLLSSTGVPCQFVTIQLGWLVAPGWLASMGGSCLFAAMQLVGFHFLGGVLLVFYLVTGWASSVGVSCCFAAMELGGGSHWSVLLVCYSAHITTHLQFLVSYSSGLNSIGAREGLHAEGEDAAG